MNPVGNPNSDYMKNNRRKFVKQSAFLAGISALPVSMTSLDWKEEKPVNVGVIGAGSRGQGLISIMNEMEGLNVNAICDVMPFRIEETKKMVPSAKAYETYTDLLKDNMLDAVVISTPFALHADMAIAAIRADKHVYCEKTLARGINALQLMVDTQKQSKRIFQTGHQYHSSPLYQKVVKIIQSGYIGEVTGFSCQWNRNADWRRPVLDPKWERLVNWRMYREYSGGLMAELCSHQVDFINWVLDATPTKVTGFGGIDHWKDGRETFDNIHVLFEYPGGIDASFTCTTTNGYEDYKIRVLGKKGTIILDYTRGEIFAEKTDAKELGIVDGVSGATVQAWEEGKGAPIGAPGNDPTIDALQQFHASITRGAPVISTLRSGAQTAKCVQIALDAMNEEKVKYWSDYPELKF